MERGGRALNQVGGAQVPLSTPAVYPLMRSVSAQYPRVRVHGHKLFEYANALSNRSKNGFRPRGRNHRISLQSFTSLDQKTGAFDDINSTVQPFEIVFQQLLFNQSMTIVENVFSSN
jgi:hypothetical protein